MAEETDERLGVCGAENCEDSAIVRVRVPMHDNFDQPRGWARTVPIFPVGCEAMIAVCPIHRAAWAANWNEYARLNGVTKRQ